MNPGYNPEMHARRIKMAREALKGGKGFGHLAQKWNVTSTAARDWCLGHLSADECGQLAQFGRLARHEAYAGIRERMELITLCRANQWSDARIASAIGITRSGLCHWLRRNAPDGVADALSDFRDDEAA